MQFFNMITQGPSRSGLRVVLGAQEKMGKTTISSMAPAPLLVPTEVGFAGVMCPRLPMIQDFATFENLLDQFIGTAQAGQFPFRTLIFDSVTAIERMIHEYVLQLDPATKNGKTNTMESAHGGYGKAYTLANMHFERVLQKLDVLAVNCSINIIFTCHVFSSKVMDPTSGEYDSWDILLHSPKNQKTYGKRELLTQWADVIAFIYEPIYTVTSEGKSTMVKGVSQNKGRVMGLSRTPAYTAGNRFGLQGEIPIPPPPQNGWNAFAEALYNVSGIDVYTR